MLSAAPQRREAVVDIDDEWFTRWRAQELSRVGRAGITYVDYTGAALYPESLVTNDAARLTQHVLGNPHSENTPSRDATDDVHRARAAILAFLHASPDEYVAILTSNATAGCRLVGESFPFEARSVLTLSADNHNSVNGLREFAVSRGATIRTISLDENLRLVDPLGALEEHPGQPSLLAFPAQSNFSGVRHPLSLISEAQTLGWRVLLDAASFVPGADLRLDQVKPDFVVLSIYKIIGYPTGIGALVARRDALEELHRPWFAGGTVMWASVQHRRHRLSVGPEGFEDGTPPFLAAGAVPSALAAAQSIDRQRLTSHLRRLTADFLAGVSHLRHDTGDALVQVHGPADSCDRGPTVALSLRDRNGAVIPYWVVEEAARGMGVALRGGCFCNPGCAERAFRFDPALTGRCLTDLGDAFTIPRFASCLGDQVVGAVRVSFGLGSLRADVARVLEFLSSYVDGFVPTAA